MGLGEFRLNGRVLEFLERYPEIEIDLVLDDRVVDLIEEGVDLAIRLDSQLPPNAVVRALGASPRLVVASPAYLAAAPRIRRPEDLAAHEYIRYAGRGVGDRLEFSKGEETVAVTTHDRYRVNNSLALRQCFLQGIGLGTAPAWLVQGTWSIAASWCRSCLAGTSRPSPCTCCIRRAVTSRRERGRCCSFSPSGFPRCRVSSEARPQPSLIAGRANHSRPLSMAFQ
ncbi:MAG: substrate binding domain-containing protein [Burkholderia sp.]